MNIKNNYTKKIEKKILDNTFSDKKDLKEYLDRLLAVIEENSELRHDLIDIGFLDGYDSSHKDIYKYFFEYYDKYIASAPNLNVNDVSTVNIEDKDYIKYKDQDGEYRVIDNQGGKDHVEEMKEKQDSALMFQTGDGDKNRETVLKAMTEERKETNLESTVSAKKDYMTVDEINDFESINNHKDFKDRQLIFNASENIYIDKNTGETFYIYTNSQGTREIRRANEKTAEVETYETKSVDTNEEKATENVQESTIIYKDMPDADLHYALENRQFLTEQQVLEIQSEIERRENMLIDDLQYQKKDKPKVKVYEMLQKPYNGFTSFLTLGLILVGYAVGFISYILFICNK